MAIKEICLGQEMLLRIASFANTFAREALHCIDLITRQDTTALSKLIHSVVFTVFSMLSPVFFLVAMPCQLLSHSLGNERIRIEYSREALLGSLKPEYKTEITVISLNTALQGVFAPFSAGVIHENEKMPSGNSRIEELAETISAKNVDVFFGQEVESLAAQDTLVRLLKDKGFHYFVRDFGNHPVYNNSGTFLASKIPFTKLDFKPYAKEDRQGLAKWSSQGALFATFDVGGKELTFANVHLNYGDETDPKCQVARVNQLAKYVFSTLEDVVVVGDFNFDTRTYPDAIPNGYTNLLAGQTTCSDRLKHSLRGKAYDAGHQCKASIDGIVFKPEKVTGKILESFETDLSDHYVNVATFSHASSRA